MSWPSEALIGCAMLVEICKKKVRIAIKEHELYCPECNIKFKVQNPFYSFRELKADA